MRGLDPRIHADVQQRQLYSLWATRLIMDGRVKPGHDAGGRLALRLLASLFVWLILTGCAGFDPTCRGEYRRTAELFFGRNIGGQVGVSEAEFSRFVTREITPRFPDGLTVIDARGQWRDPERNIVVREPSKVVTIVLPSGNQDARLQEIIEAYKARFRQQSVALIVRPACVSF
jgi:hypothetical protein